MTMQPVINFKLKPSLAGSGTFHLDPYTYMEHAHPPCAQLVLHMSLTYTGPIQAKILTHTNA